ncbi:unnamed protein product [Rhizopus stolonifer]
MDITDIFSSQSDSDSALGSSVTKTTKLTGLPTKESLEDSEAENCELIGCTTRFRFFERKHHCRKCGGIFCTAHCSNYFRLDQYAHFHLQGTLSRGCSTCTEKYKQWQEELRQPKQTGKKENKNETNKKRHAGIMTQQPQAMEGITELGRDDIVSKGVNINKLVKKENGFNPVPSVPADWQWSTF